MLTFFVNSACRVPLTTCNQLQARRLISQEAKKRLRDNTVYQHASKNTKRTDRLYGWGLSKTGAIGIETFIRPKKHHAARLVQLNPYRLAFFDAFGQKVNTMACGYGTTIFGIEDKSTGEQSLYGTGINTDSQIGFIEEPPNSGRFVDYIAQPTKMKLPFEDPKKLEIQHIACGRAHTVIATNQGLYTLGHNAYGQCGRQIVPGEVFRGNQNVNKLPIDFNIKQVECGQDHTLLLSDTGEVYSCGLGSDGQTGQGHHRLVDSFQRVCGDVEGVNIVTLSSRVDCVLAVSECGEVFGWGNNEYNQLAAITKDQSQVATPQRLALPGVGKVKSAAVAGATCAVLNEDGDVYVWGYGILGKGPNVDQSERPTLIPPALFGRNEFNPEVRIKDIKCGINYFAALLESGDLYTWGKNKNAALGHGNVKDHFFPYKAHIPADVQSLHCGTDHMFVMCKSFV